MKDALKYPMIIWNKAELQKRWQKISDIDETMRQMQKFAKHKNCSELRELIKSMIQNAILVSLKKFHWKQLETLHHNRIKDPQKLSVEKVIV